MQTKLSLQDQNNTHSRPLSERACFSPFVQKIKIKLSPEIQLDPNWWDKIKSSSEFKKADKETIGRTELPGLKAVTNPKP